MALTRLIRFYLNTAVDFNLYRSEKLTSTLVRSQKYATVKNINKDAPIKYTTHKASKVLIADNLRLTQQKDIPWFQPEENDIDEILKGNYDSKSDYALYIDLIIKLNFCKQNNLPTEGLIAKIEEVKKRLNTSKDV